MDEPLPSPATLGSDESEAARPPATNAAQRYLEHALDLIEQRALHGDRIDWQAVRAHTAILTRRASRPAQTYGAIRSVLRQLEDGHSLLVPPSAAKRWATRGTRNPSPEVRLRFGGVGFVAVPAYDGGDPTAVRHYALNLQGRIADKAAEVRCGFVVDLRRNFGGNMWPMLGGLAPLLGDGTLGYFVDRHGHGEPWSLHRGNLRVGSEVWLDLGREHRELAALPPVAVLTSAVTTSSGEAVAIAFRQRPHTRSFGQPTRGLSTANDVLPLGDGANLILTVSVMADRTGRIYGGRVVPDVTTPPSSGDAAGAGDWDADLAAAVRWLKGESGCSATAGSGVRSRPATRTQGLQYAVQGLRYDVLRQQSGVQRLQGTTHRL